MPASVKGQRPRQDPVSCQLCRTKKLKCNREHPCSNCLARGVTCTLGNAVLPAATSPRSAPPNSEASAILSRLDRIESLILSQKGSPSLSMKQSPATAAPSPSQANSATHSTHSEQEEAHRLDSEHLYSTATREKSLLFAEGYNIQVRLAHTRDLLTRAREPVDQIVGKYSTWEPRRLFWLPPKDQALAFVEIFVECVDFCHHVIYTPKAKAIIDGIYQNLLRQDQLDPSHLALLLAMFASVACYRSTQSFKEDLFSNKQLAMDATKLWLRHSMDLLEISRRTGSGTVEDVETAIVLCFLIFNLEGFSVRARSLHSIALSTARDIGLHKIDTPDGRMELAKESHAIVEMKRRLMWHVASTDWLLGVAGGPQEGSYFMNPKFMRVNRPRNVSDEELEADGPQVNHPLSTPTQMSYFLMRVRSAELARMIADAWPMGINDIEEVDYAEIVAVDAKFEEMLDEMPVYFRVDEDSRRQAQPCIDKYPQLILQKYLIQLAVQMRRCKLHQPFLVRGSQDPRFKYSRDACLRAARATVHCKEQLDKENENELVPSGRLALNLFVTHHLFIATVVLVMDLCFTRIEGQDEARRREVIHACKVLEDAKGHSNLANRFLRSLTDVLRKHKIYISNTPPGDSPVKPEKGPIGPGPGAISPDNMTAQQRQQQQQQQQDLAMSHLRPGAFSDTPANWAVHSKDIDMLNNGPAASPHPSIIAGAVTTAPGMAGPQPAPFTPVSMASGGVGPGGLPFHEVDDIWRSYLNQGASFEASAWDSIFSDLENPSSVAFGTFDMSQIPAAY